jgi:16S rRNA (uracil1498-N3)-methyltransferase
MENLIEKVKRSKLSRLSPLNSRNKAVEIFDKVVRRLHDIKTQTRENIAWIWKEKTETTHEVSKSAKKEIGMQRHRFYAAPSSFTESSVMLDAEETRHLTQVLRLGEGARVFVFNGEGAEYECEVARAGKREVELNLARRLDDVVESPLRMTLAQALIKGDKFDWVIQKATELGVTRIVPLVTDHNDIKRAEERAEQRLQRWRRISLEALKQCGRRRLVEICEPAPFDDFCESAAPGARLIFSERGGESLRGVSVKLQDVNQLSLCVAAEGGWSERELRRAESGGFTPVSLGSRVLRTETAAIVAVTLAQHLFGDLR